MSTLPQYLRPDFDPSSLPIGDLRAILLENQLALPSTPSTKKSDLVKSFNTYIKPNVPQLRAEYEKLKPSRKGMWMGGSPPRPEDNDNTGDDGDGDGDYGRGVGTASKSTRRGRPRKTEPTFSPQDDDDDDMIDSPSQTRTTRGSRRPRKSAPASSSNLAREFDGNDEDSDVGQTVVGVPSGKGKGKATTATSGVRSTGRRKSTRLSGDYEDEGDTSASVSVKKGRRGRKSSTGGASSRSRSSSPTKKPRASRGIPLEPDEDFFAPSSNPAPAGPSGTSNAMVFSPSLQFDDEESSGYPGGRYGSGSGNSRSASPSKLHRKKSGGGGAPGLTPGGGLAGFGQSIGQAGTPPSPFGRPSEGAGFGSPAMRRPGFPDTSVGIGIGGGNRPMPVQGKKSNDGPVVRKTRKQSNGGGNGLLMCTILLVITYGIYWAMEKHHAGLCDSIAGDVAASFGEQVESATTNSRINNRGFISYLAPRPQDLSPGTQSIISGSLIIGTISSLCLRPSCSPCPSHGVCSDGRLLNCEKEYVYSAPSSVLTLGGLIPKSPSCEPDTEKLLMVMEEASRISKVLRSWKGDIVCGNAKVGGGENGKGKKGTIEDWQFGLEFEMLKEIIYGGPEFVPDKELFEEVINLALEDLVSHGEAIVGKDEDGKFWYASTTADLSLTCRAKLAAIDWAYQRKTEIATIIISLFTIFYLKAKYNAHRAERDRVNSLVRVALQKIKEQERYHYVDPVIYPEPFLAPAHLRDAVLAEVHSPARRRELWKKVERVVQGNSNVRSADTEYRGETIRTWQWVGGRGGDIDTPVRKTSDQTRTESPQTQGRGQNFQQGQPMVFTKPELLLEIN